MKEQIQAILADTKIPIEERIARADKIYSDAIQSATRSNHDKDEEFATLLSDYAHFLYEYAHYPQAEHIYQRLITLQEKINGTNHPDTATAYDNIGLIYNKEGYFDKALEYYKKALLIREAVLGYNNPDIATSFNNFGIVYYEQGEYNKALKFINKAIEIRERILGTNNPNTAASYNDSGRIYYEQGEYENALDFFNKALSILDKNHPDTATTYDNIAKVYFERGEYERASELFDKALDIREKVLGNNHPDTATSYNNIGWIYDEQSDFDSALKHYYKALNIRKEVFGSNHPDTAKSYNNIGTVYYSKGDYDKALEYLLKALDIIKYIFGENHPDTASTYNNVGLVYNVQGNNDQALEYYFKALEIREDRLGKKHPDTASSYYNIGGIYYSQGNLDKALKYYNIALNIRIDVLGNDHPDSASLFQNLGSLFLELGDFNKALEYHKNALDIRKKVLGESHVDTARSYKNMGTIYYLQENQDNKEMALEYYDKARLIFEKRLGEDDPETADIYNKIGQVYDKRNEIEKAREFYSKSIPIIEKKLGVESTNDTSNQYTSDDQNIEGLTSDSLDKDTFKIIYDITKCTAALNDVHTDFQKQMQTLADDLRQMFRSEYCAIGIVDDKVAEDCIVSLDLYEEESRQKLQTELLDSVRFVDINNKSILLCRALDLKSQNIVYFNQEDISLSETFDKFQVIMKSGTVFSNIVIPLRDKYKQNIGYLQFLNSKNKFEYDRISHLLTAFLGLAKTILQKNNKQRKENREKDFDFYDKIQKAKGANRLFDEIMKYLATEFNAAIVTFRIPIANASSQELSHFYLRRCFVNSRIINYSRIKNHYYADRMLIPKEEMGGYEDLRTVHKGKVIYHDVKNTNLNNKFDLDLYDKFIILPVFRDDITKKTLIKQLYGTFQLRLFKPAITKDKGTELISRIRFEKELADIRKRLEYLSEQITLLCNSYVHKLENDSLLTFQNELRNSSFVKIQDFDERCVQIIKKSVHPNVCSIYRYDKLSEQLKLSATTAKTIHINSNNENLDANITKERFSIPTNFNKNILVRAFNDKRSMYILDINNSKTHQASFIENIHNKFGGKGFLSAMIVPILKKNGECSGVVLLLGKDNPNYSFSPAYWEQDVNHIEFIVNTLTRISESDNERMAFLSQLSHELLSPVTKMVYDNDYIITLANANPKSVTKQELISQLKDNLDTCMLLKYLINDTEFRYASSGRKMDYNIIRQDRPQEVIMDAIHLLNKEAIDKGLDIRTYLSNMPTIYFDRERIMQVFLNLLKNAIRYSYNSTTISINYLFKNDQHEIVFANHGIGIQEKEKEKIFDLFYRSEEAKIKSDSGTGIGLYIVRDIMRDHGGDCFVRNLKDPTEFVITLPKTNN